MKNQKLLDIISWTVATLTLVLLLAGYYYHLVWSNAETLLISDAASQRAENLNLGGAIGWVVTVCLMTYLYATSKRPRYLVGLMTFLLPVIVLAGFFIVFNFMLSRGFID